MKKYKFLWAVVYTVLLMAFTAYVLLDTFVIKRVYSTVNDDSSVQSSLVQNSENDNQSAVVAEKLYENDNITVKLSDYRQYDTEIYVADVTLSSADYFKTAFANDEYGRNVTEKTSEIAGRNNAVLAVNGDFYGAQEDGYVIRNGKIYRDTSAGREDLVVNKDGSFKIINENDTTADELLSGGAWQVLSFGPALVTNGEISITEDEEVGKAMASNPRTAVAVLGKLHYLFITSDGRTNESEGLSLYELAEFSRSLGAKTVYNLDGGGSATMYFNGNVVNNPTTNGHSIKERSVSDIVYIGQ